MTSTQLTRDQLAEKYLAELPHQPYPMQEEALLAWFTSEQGVMVCAPTGMGKTLIAHAALYEALHTGRVAYYTTPLIALTEQKFREMQERALSWGFEPGDVGLVTGNRRVNPGAKVLVVVAEILLNRLLHREAFDFSDVSAVVMDEFHSFADPERGIVWELTLSLLPPHIRLLLLSATVGNSLEFIQWLARCHGRQLELVESNERRVPLTYEWIPDMLLTEAAVELAKGDGHTRRTPALIFCFNRDECWNVAETLKGLPLVSGDQKSQLHEEVNRLDWREGAGPKMKQLLHRGVGVHHAGVLPRYRRAVEELFNRKLLPYVICTETLAAGINLPARSVILTRLVKGPPGKEKLIDPSTAHQIFGRAGRPQFDDRGYVIALAPEDDVKILRWKEKYDQIPDNTKDPALIKAKKALKKKKPTRSENRTYWNEGQFKMLQGAKPGKLYSKGPLPWRLLAYMLQISPEVDRIRRVIRKRLLDEPRIQAGEKALDRILVTLAKGGFVTLDSAVPGMEARSGTGPEPRTQRSGVSGTGPEPGAQRSGVSGTEPRTQRSGVSGTTPEPRTQRSGVSGTGPEPRTQRSGVSGTEPATASRPTVPNRWLDLARELGLEMPEAEPATAQAPAPENHNDDLAAAAPAEAPPPAAVEEQPAEPPPAESMGASPPLSEDSLPPAEAKTLDFPEGYSPTLAHPTPELDKLLVFRSIHPLYAAFLLRHLGIANRDERLQALESVLEMPGSVLRLVRVPSAEELPPGPLAIKRLDEELLRRGLMLQRHASTYEADEDEEEDRWDRDDERPPTLADKLYLLFEATYPDVTDVCVQPVWCAGEVLRFGGNFNKYVQAKNLVKQEGIIFRHLLRLILLCGEFLEVTPEGTTREEWQADLRDVADRLTAACRAVDPESTDLMIEMAHAADVVEGETEAAKAALFSPVG